MSHRDAPREADATLLESVVENLYNCIAVSKAIREQGRIVDFQCTYVNRAYEETLGQKRQEIIQETLLQRNPGMREDGLFDQFVRVVETGQPMDIEHHYQKDGMDLHIRLVVKKFGDGILAAFHDIARRKRSETELRKVNQDLEDRVEKRTAELRHAQERIQQALEVAQRSNAAKSEFLAMVSHDLRSPLTAIQGYVSLLESEGLPHEQAEQLHVIDNCAEGLLRLLDDLLRFSRLEAGQFVLENEPFLLPPLLTETLDIFRPAARQKNLELRLEAGPGLPRVVVGDAAQLRRIITNLVGNALKFTERGSVIVRIQAMPQADASWLLLGEVEDTGPGFSEEVARDLFQPYHQGTGASRRTNSGVGLGLAICRRLCELMGGEIAVESSPGKGSKFRFQVRFGIVGEG